MDNARTKLQGLDALQRVFRVPPPCLPVRQRPNDCGKCHKAYNKCGGYRCHPMPSHRFGEGYSFDCIASWHSGTWHAVVSCCRRHRLVQGSRKDTRKKKGAESVGYLRLRRLWSWAESQCLCLYGLDALSGEKGWACEKELQVIQASKSLGVWVSEHHQ